MLNRYVSIYTYIPVNILTSKQFVCDGDQLLLMPDLACIRCHSINISSMGEDDSKIKQK